MAAEIREAFPDAYVELVRASGGRFDVKRDGEPVYEKTVTGRFPDAGEVVALLKSPAAPPRGAGFDT